jgi:hypothetical protein
MQIVFAHFYSRLPKHLVLNLKRNISLFPDHQVCLITDQDISHLQLLDLKVVKYNPSSSWQEMESILDHPVDFRNNFWFVSLARFIAIAEISKNSPAPILHVESDVLLAPDFPFHLFSKLEQEFAFPVVSNDLAIASCLYIKNGLAAQTLARFTIQSVISNTSTTDMHILKNFINEHGNKIQMLPSGPYQPSAFENTDSEFLKQTKSSISYFHGIFDGFDIGRFLFGDDPRNNRGLSVLRQNDSRTYLDASKIDLLMTKDRDFPSVKNISEFTLLPVYSLHVHSKKLNIFREKHTNKLIKKAVLNSKSSSRTIFSFSVFFKSLIAALLRRIKYVRFLW